MSDIVFLRAWTKVDIPKFFNPVTTLLQAKGTEWKGMKTVGELRRLQKLPIPVNPDSLYKVKWLLTLGVDLYRSKRGFLTIEICVIWKSFECGLLKEKLLQAT